MKPRINIITLGVQNIEQSRKFYEALGWKASSASNEHMVAFQGNGIVLCLYPEEALAEDANAVPSKGFRGVTLAYNAPSKQEVDQALKKAAQAGAKIVKEAQDVFWGGYSGYFADPNDHLWEVAWNPHWPLDSNGNIKLPS